MKSSASASSASARLCEFPGVPWVKNSFLSQLNPSVRVANAVKTLLLLRHAKSSWDDKSLRDFDRPLNKRGLKAAPMVGETIRKRKLRPELVLSSPAERAKETTRLVCDAAGLIAVARYEDGIYEASARRLLEIVSRIEDAVNTAMLVGHNPGLEELLGVLTNEAHRMPTASLASIELRVERWSEVTSGTGKLQWILKPKELK
jgi:phosphohistidine phosphatase